jgi:diketogulonate reductase-like aldo/keto reductase
MGERRDHRAGEIAALRQGLDLGMTLVDTAEMYGDGATEELIGHAIADRREEFFLVSKVLPQHATHKGTVQACESSLKRLRTDRIDLYLLHWRGSVPLEDTLEGFSDLMRTGKIRDWGVSNFDVDDMKELDPIARTTGRVASTNQVLYNLMRRGIEWDLLPYCRSNGVPIMAYSPIEQSRLATATRLKNIAERHHASAAQISLAWVLRQHGVIAIPKASRREHLLENRRAMEISLAPEDLIELDTLFAAPKKKVPLEML